MSTTTVELPCWSRRTAGRDRDRTAPCSTHAGIGRSHQAPRPQRHRGAAGTGLGPRAKSLFEVVHQRRSARAHAFLRGAEHHIAVAVHRDQARSM